LSNTFFSNKSMSNKSFSTRSLRFQLIFSASVLMLLISLIALVAVKRYAYQTAQISYDRYLSNSARQIMDQVRFNNLQFSVDIPFSAFKSLTNSPRDKVYYLVTTQGLNYITGYQSLLEQKMVINTIQNYPIKLEPEAEFFDLKFKDSLIRFSIVSRAINTSEGPKNVFILIGQTTESRKAWEKELSNFAAKLILAFVACALLVIIILINKVLKSVNTINQKIAKRSNVDLTPIRLDAPQEINHLINTINQFMAQLDSTLTNLKNFTSEAAHQLNTPLAGLRAQLDLALNKSKEPETLDSLRKISSACHLLERTILQLLNHATIKHRYQSIEPEAINFNELVKTVCRDLAINALQQEIELSYQDSLQFSIQGDEFALSQMLKNLIENAIKYSSKGGVIEVEIFQQGSKAVLFIRDYGPGIDAADKPYVFERFYRSPNANSNGTGLGMSIALDVARKSNAILSLEDSDPHGLTVKVQFPHKFWQAII